MPYLFVYNKLIIILWAKCLTFKKNAIMLIVYRYREQKETATMALYWLLTYGREWDGTGNGKRLRWVWLRSVDTVIMSRSVACGAAIRLICILNLPHPSRITQAERLYPICIPQPTTLINWSHRHCVAELHFGCEGLIPFCSGWSEMSVNKAMYNIRSARRDTLLQFVYVIL